MRAGYWVVAVFGAAWAGAGLLVAGYPAVALIAPLAVSAALLLWAYKEPSAAAGMSPQVRKVIVRWSLVEAGAIALASNLLSRMHRTDGMFSAVAVIVGLHFFPLARGIPVRQYYATGAALILVGLGGMLLPAPERPISIGLSAAVILWGTAAWRLLEGRRAAAA
jgi:hypothetical protein